MSISDKQARESLAKDEACLRHGKTIEHMEFYEVLKTREELHRYNWVIFDFPVVRRDRNGYVAQAVIRDDVDQLFLVENADDDGVCYDMNTTAIIENEEGGLFEGLPYREHPKVWLDRKLYELQVKLGKEKGRYAEMTFSDGHDTDIRWTELDGWEKAKLFIEEHGTNDYVLEISRPGIIENFILKARHIETLDTHDPGYRGYRTHEEVCKELTYMKRLWPECKRRRLLRLVKISKEKKRRKEEQKAMLGKEN